SRHGRRLGMLRLEERCNLTTFLVTNLLDGAVIAAGQLPGSLRQAIFDANNNPGADVVDATGVSGTITLAPGELKITDSTTVTGPGASKLTVDANNKNRILNISISAGKSATVTGIHITKGASPGTSQNGGGIVVSSSSSATVTLSGLLVDFNRIITNAD